MTGGVQGDLELRPLREGDEGELLRIHATPEVARWWDGPAEGFPWDEPEATRLTILVDGEVAGMIQFSEELEPKYRHASIDLFLDPSFHGRGLGPEAIRRVVRHLTDDRGHHRVTIDPAAANGAAIRAYEKAGFLRVGLMRRYERDADGDGWHDGVLMELLADEDRSAAARWRRLVADRLDEFERLAPGMGVRSGAFWERRASRRERRPEPIPPEDDPLLRRLRRLASPSTTVLDVGAGSGRLALPLAASVAHVTAVDRSEAMLARLRDDAEERAIGNVTTVSAPWQEADVEAADIAFSAFVLTLVEDAAGFIEKLDRSAREHVFLYLGAYSADAVIDPLWRHFHGAPRPPGPTYLDALDVVRELGIEPETKAVELLNRRRFESAEDAVDHYREALLLDDTAEVRRELAGLLDAWLLGRRGSRRSPMRTVPAAIVHWVPTLR